MPIFPRYSGPPLLAQACGIENLTTAWQRVRSNIQVARRGRSAGADAVTLRDFEADWANQMARLADELRSGSYRPLPPRTVHIPKASGGERAIAILAIRDRVAQRAVQQVLTPLFEPLFAECSYGCRARVGVPEALNRVARYAEQGLVWVVDADIASYFDSLDQRILLGLLRQRIDEPPILQLIAGWLQAGSMHEADSTPISAGPGLSQGLVQKGGELLRDLLSPPPPIDLRDPYAAAGWEAAAPTGWDAAPPRRGLGNSALFTALGLAQPAIEGARAALPHLRRIGGRRLLIGGALAAGAVAAGELLLRAQEVGGRGTPQGGALSPLLANIYLHPFDLAMHSHGLRMVRFMDDFVLLCATREEAERALDLTRRQITALRLTLNEEKTQIVAYAEGLAFLGQALAPRQRGPRLTDGLTSFAEAETRLRAVATRAKQGWKPKKKG